jgi:flagellar hook-associated protein 1 FlgK
MGSTFGIYNTAASGLRAYQTRTDIASHNIANAGTPGFTRRRAIQVPFGSNSVPGIWSRNDRPGDGAEVIDIERLRDLFLEQRLVSETGNAGYYGKVAGVMGRIEALYPEPSDTGIAGRLTELWGAWDDLSANPVSIAGRRGVLSKAQSVVDALRKTAADLTDNRTGLLTETQGLVDTLNLKLEQVARFNESIARAYSGDVPAGDLEDQRDVVIREIAKIADLRVIEKDNGMSDLYIAGRQVVQGVDIQRFTLTDGVVPPVGSVADQAGVTIVELTLPDGIPLTIGGELGGAMRAYNVEVPQVMKDMNDVAARLVTDTNTLHVTAFGTDGFTGRNFFAAAGVTAATIALDPAVDGIPGAVGASATGAVYDGDMARQIAALSDSTTGADELYRALIGDLGQVTSLANIDAIQTETIRMTAEQAREALSGVNLDEEVSLLMQHQQAYTANARVISTLEQMMDALLSM